MSNAFTSVAGRVFVAFACASSNTNTRILDIVFSLPLFEVSRCCAHAPPAIVERMKENNAARQLFLQQSFGVLSTISLDVPGYPFGSITPYCADRQCRPVIYISRIAQHTQNILADSRVSLTVLENADSGDVQARGRLTCIANARPLSNDEEDVSERYFRYVPQARNYAGTHDFEFFRLELVRVRFIGGFGRIYWIEPDQFISQNPFSPSQ